MCGIPITTEYYNKVTFSVPYFDETMAFIVADNRRGDFSHISLIQQMTELTIGIPASEHFIEIIEEYIPNAKIIRLNSPRDFFRGRHKDLDAMLFTAESGSAWSLVYPDFSVAVPQPVISRLPFAYPMARGDRDFHEYINTWIELRKKDGLIANLYDHWIKGKGAESQRPRWSILRDVLGWGGIGVRF